MGRPAARVLEALLTRLLAGWRHGALDVELPGGRVIGAGSGAPRARAVVRDHRFLLRMLLRGEMGAGESYVAGEWDSPDLVGLLRLFVANFETVNLDRPITRLARLPSRLRHILRSNTRAGSRRNIHAHYDLGNDFYALLLGESWTYSCGVWSDGATTLEEAQDAKHERICRALDLSPADHLLEIGCGWGSLALWAARTRGCRVTGITVSPAQHRLARRRVAEAGLEDLVRIELCDYRDARGRFDKIASVEMIEAVGYRYLPGFFAACRRLLAPGGTVALQSILMPEHRFEAYRRSIDWTQTYVFPGSLIPSLGVLRRAFTGAGFELVRADEIGPDYAPTLASWRRRFHGALADVRGLGFDEPFLRLWDLYLAFSEAAFAERSLGNAQLILG